MKPKPIDEAEKYRIKSGPYASDSSVGNNGAFSIPYNGIIFTVLISNQLSWEHVSVSIASINRSPTWDEMCHFKNMFWEKDETVIEYHPAEKDYVNMHPYALHMWKPTDKEIPIPPSIMVGWKPKRKRHNKITYKDAMLVRR